MEFIDYIDTIHTIDTMKPNCSLNDNEYDVYTSNYEHTNNLIRMFLICGGVFMTSSISALMIISRMLINNLENEYKSLYGYNSDEEEFFDSKYLQEYNELEEKPIDTFEFLNNKIIKEKTPDGVVYLGYDSKKEAFLYYSDFKDIAYNYLEVCARKFVIEHNCKCLLLNTKHEIIKAFKMFTNNEHESTDSIFAKLKTEDVNKKESIDHKLKIKTKQLPVPENSNKFVFKGKLSNYCSAPDPDPVPVPEVIEIDYKTFKNKQMN